jgi:CubicO group peptidase (beta-lactamase class C family)
VTVDHEDAVDGLMSGFPPPPGQRVRLDQVYDDPRITRWYMQHVRELSPTAHIFSGRGSVSPLPEDPQDLDAVEVARAGGGRWTVAEMLRGCCVDGIAVVRRGRLVYERYLNGLRPETPHLAMSVTKSIGSCVAATLVEDGQLRPDDDVTAYVPELAGSAYGDAAVRHLLDMTVGIRYVDDLDDPSYEGARLCRLEGVQPSLAPDEPGSAYDFALTTTKEGEHGRAFHYVSLNTLVLGWVMERVTGVGVPRLISERLWSALGAEHDAAIALDGGGSAQLEGGLCCSLRDLARFGRMLCDDGRVDGRQVVPAAWLDDVRRNGDKRAFAAAAEDWVAARSSVGSSYRSCFWVTEAADHVTFSAAGWLGQRVHVVPEAGVVIALFSSRPQSLDAELGAHVFQACEDLAAGLA